MRRAQRILGTMVGAAVALLIGLLLLVLMVLRSPIPARLVADAMESATGMTVRIGALHLGWSGRSHVGDLTLSMPEGGVPLLTLDEARFEHAPLWRLLVTRKPALSSIAVEGARIVLAEADDGRWNVAPLLAGRGDDRESASIDPEVFDAGRLRLPAVMMRDTRFEYRPSGREPTALGPFSMTVEATANGDRVTWTNDRDLQAVAVVRKFVWPGGTGMDVWRGLDADVTMTFSNVDLSWLAPQVLGTRTSGPPPLGTYTGRAHFVASGQTPAKHGGEITFELTGVGPTQPLLAEGRGVIQVDLADAAGPRLVMPRSRWRLAEGEVELWGRASRPDQVWRLYANAQLKRVPMQPLLMLAGAGPSAPVGRLDGDVRLTLPVGQLDRVYSDVRLKLSESDLANTGLFAAIYNVFNIRLGAAAPTGRGELIARLEGPLFHVRAMRYANRGMDLQLGGRVVDIYRGADSPLRAYAMGATRPLPNLPLLAELNDILGVLGQGVTAVRITGTLAQPKVEPMSLAQARRTVSELINGGQPPPAR